MPSERCAWHPASPLAPTACVRMEYTRAPRRVGCVWGRRSCLGAQVGMSAHRSLTCSTGSLLGLRCNSSSSCWRARLLGAWGEHNAKGGSPLPPGALCASGAEHEDRPQCSYSSIMTGCAKRGALSGRMHHQAPTTHRESTFFAEYCFLLFWPSSIFCLGNDDKEHTGKAPAVRSPLQTTAAGIAPLAVHCHHLRQDRRCLVFTVCNLAGEKPTSFDLSQPTCITVSHGRVATPLLQSADTTLTAVRREA